MLQPALSHPVPGYWELGSKRPHLPGHSHLGQRFCQDEQERGGEGAGHSSHCSYQDLVDIVNKYTFICLKTLGKFPEILNCF